jgi:predicted metal-dependent peptidase
MLETKHAPDPVAREVVSRAMSLLVLRDLLSGLTLQGEAIRIRETDDPAIWAGATNGHYIWYSAKWVKERNINDVVFLLLHEWLHIFGNHVPRCGDRDPKVWNIAIDYVVNREALSILRGYTVPEGGLVPPTWTGMLSAEEIYNKLMSDDDKLRAGMASFKGLDLLAGGSSPAGDPGPAEEQENDSRLNSAFHDLFRSELTMAEAAAHTAKQPIGARVLSRLREIQRTNPPWERLILGAVMDGMGHDEYSYSPPSYRYWPDTVTPRWHSNKAASLLIAVDVSGSVSAPLLKKLVSVAAPAVTRAEKTCLITFDSSIQEVRQIRTAKEVLKLSFNSGRHCYTDANDIFDYAREHKYGVVLCATDMLFAMPVRPFKTTVWATPVEAPAATWGKQYRMQEFW